MASEQKSKRIAEVLTAKADEVFAALRTGKTLDEIAQPLGIWPFHIRKFYAGSPVHRDAFREALDVNAKMQIVRPRRSRKRSPGTAQAVLVRRQAAMLKQLAAGRLIRELAEQYDVNRASIIRYFTRHPDESVRQAYVGAMRASGSALAEESVLVTRRPALDMTDAKMAGLRAGQLAWLAAKRDPVYAGRQSIDLKGRVVGNVSVRIGV